MVYSSAIAKITHRRFDRDQGLFITDYDDLLYDLVESCGDIIIEGMET